MQLDSNIVSLIAVAAGVLILTGWVQQVYRGYKTKSMKDISPYLMTFILIGAILWLIYSVIIEDVFLMGTNIAAIILMIIVLSMKRRYG